MYSPGAAAALERLRVLETADRERAAAEAAAEVATRHQERAYHHERALQVRRWHGGVGTDEKPAWARGYASGGCVSQKLRPTACGRQ